MLTYITDLYLSVPYIIAENTIATYNNASLSANTEPVDQLRYMFLEKQIHQMKAMVKIVNISILYMSFACMIHVSAGWIKAIQYLQTEYNWKPNYPQIVP